MVTVASGHARQNWWEQGRQMHAARCWECQQMMGSARRSVVEATQDYKGRLDKD